MWCTQPSRLTPCCALYCVLCAVLSLKGKQLGLDCDVCSQIGEGKNNEKLRKEIEMGENKKGDEIYLQRELE